MAWVDAWGNEQQFFESAALLLLLLLLGRVTLVEAAVWWEHERRDACECFWEARRREYFSNFLDSRGAFPSEWATTSHGPRAYGSGGVSRHDETAGKKPALTLIR